MSSSFGSDIANFSDVQPQCSFIENANCLGFNINNFNCASININSILCQSRLSQIESIMKHNNLAIFAIQESKLDSSKDPSCYKIEGYNVIAKNRPTGRGGGLLLYIRGDIAFRHLPNLENSTPCLEHIAAEVFIQNKRILFNNIYRPPNCDKTTFLHNLSSTIETIRQNNFFMTTWMGDTNAGNNFEFFGSLKTTAIDHETASIFEGYFYTQIVDIATRLANHSISLIDVIYVDRYDLVDKTLVYSAVADHCGTAVSYDILCKRPKLKV